MVTRLIDLIQRQSMHLVLTGIFLCFVPAGLARWTPFPDGAASALSGVGFVLILVGLTFTFFLHGGDHEDPPRLVESPVRGRWLAINSPASKVPSHGVRAYGQAFAVDLVHEPLEGQPRPAFGSGSGLAAPTHFPAFGEPVRAMVSGTVVRVRDRQRDHRSRTRWWSVVVMMLEGILRELRGADGVIGNHVVIDAGDGVFALVAHLQRGSAYVGEGELVEAGQVIARCGNTGNTSEPHVHAQLMDRRRASVARGLPMEFVDVGMPANGEHLTV